MEQRLPNDKINDQEVEAAHHRWLRQILHISWKDKVTNEKVRELAQQGILEDTISKRILRWAGHVMRMDSQRMPDKLRDGNHMAEDVQANLVQIGWPQTVKVDISRGGIS